MKPESSTLFLELPLKWRWWIRFRWQLVTIVAILSVAILAGTIKIVFAEPTSLCAAAASGTLPWPIDPTSPSHVLGHNHFEFTIVPGYEDQPFLHEGIDVMATVGVAVHALEKGMVVKDPFSGTDFYAFVIESFDKPGTGYFYQHIDRTAPRKALGDAVEAGDELGDVQEFPTTMTGGVAFDHVHIEHVVELLENKEVAPNPVYDGGVWAAFRSIGSPLPQLVTFDDDAEPELLAPALKCNVAFTATAPFLFALDDSDIYVAPGELVEGEKYDVIARVGDHTNSSSPWEIMPYCIGVRIETAAGQLEYEHSFQLDAAWPSTDLGDPVELLYKTDGCLASDGGYGARAFYVITTNAPDANSAWEPKAGEYNVAIQIRDSTGQQSNTAPMPVTVSPSP